MRRESDVPIKPTFTEWLELTPDNTPYFEILNLEAQKRGIIYESGKSETTVAEKGGKNERT